MNTSHYMTTLIFTLLLLLATPMSASGNNNTNDMEKKNYYCEYRGHKFPDVRSMPAESVKKSI